MRGREKNEHYITGKAKDKGCRHPVVGLDYACMKTQFPDAKEGDDSRPILILSEPKYGLTASMFTLGKSNSAPWVIKRIAKWIDASGAMKVIIKATTSWRPSHW